MANTYRHTFVNPYPNGWKNREVSETTPIDADALQAHTDAIKEIDNFLDGVNKDQIGSVKKRVLTKIQWGRLPDTKYSDGVIYFISDAGTGPINYPNYETEAF